MRHGKVTEQAVDKTAMSGTDRNQQARHPELSAVINVDHAVEQESVVEIIRNANIAKLSIAVMPKEWTQ
jgi:hypothetical protein